MWTLLKDPDRVEELTRPYPRDGFRKEDWSGSSNIALISDNDLALFEYIRKGHYRGHYFFICRGKDAIRKAREALSFIFKSASVVEGWTPLDNKGALWLSRHLGFKSYGTLDTHMGPMEHFIMTRKEYLNE